MFIYLQKRPEKMSAFQENRADFPDSVEGESKIKESANTFIPQQQDRAQQSNLWNQNRSGEAFNKVEKGQNRSGSTDTASEMGHAEYPSARFFKMDDQESQDRFNDNLVKQRPYPDDNQYEKSAETLHFETNEENFVRNEGQNILYRGNALLYEDKSGLIIYDGTDIDIDNSLESYQKFYRIGEGALTLSKDGLHFQNDLEMRHVDFRDVEKIIFYQNCTVLLLRDQETAEIFFPDKFALFRTTFKNLLDKGRVL